MPDFLLICIQGFQIPWVVEIWKNFRRRAGGLVKRGHYNFSPCQTDRTSVAQLHEPKISHQTD